MHPIAQELNGTLGGTVVSRLLSSLGQELYFPKGIVAQSAEAGAKAHRLNATIGMAVDEGEAMVLAAVRDQTPGLSRNELASYAPTGGVLALRQAWKQQILQKNPVLKADGFSLPMVIPGLTNGIFQATELFVEAGTIVIIPDLFWENYSMIMEVRRGAEIVSFPIFGADGRFNCQGLTETLKAQAKRAAKLVVCLNFPNNPTGYSPTVAEAQAIRQSLVDQAAAGTDILVLNDDAYFGLFYEAETEKQSLFALLAEAHERILTIKIDGATKEDFVWGFRIGFMSFAGKGLAIQHYDALLNKLMGAIRGSVSSSSSLAQHIMLKAYQAADYPKQKQLKFDELRRRYQKVKSTLATWDAKGYDRYLRWLPFNSGYFMSFACQGFLAEDLRSALLAKGIGTIAFNDSLLRIAYSSVDFERIEELYSEIYLTAEGLVKA